MSTYGEIEQIELDLQGARNSYLRRHGWVQTCSTPGSYWLWRRDFATEDQQNQTNWETTCKRVASEGRTGMPSPPSPMGVITADTILAVSMTRKRLDTFDEEGDDE